MHPSGRDSTQEHLRRRAPWLALKKRKTTTTTTLMVPLDDGRRKRERLAVSRNYQLIIYVYAAVGAEGLLTPFAMDGVPRAEYITTHSYASARVSRAAPKGVGEE